MKEKQKLKFKDINVKYTIKYLIQIYLILFYQIVILQFLEQKLFEEFIQFMDLVSIKLSMS